MIDLKSTKYIMFVQLPNLYLTIYSSFIHIRWIIMNLVPPKDTSTNKHDSLFEQLPNVSKHIVRNPSGNQNSILVLLRGVILEH